MKQADVKVGGEYLVKISGREERVVVVRVEQSPMMAFERHASRTKFRVQVKASGKVLPKARTAAALRPVPAPPKAYRVSIWTLQGFVGESFDQLSDANALLDSKRGCLCCRAVIRSTRDDGLITEVTKTPPEGHRCGFYPVRGRDGETLVAYVCETSKPQLIAKYADTRLRGAGNMPQAEVK